MAWYWIAIVGLAALFLGYFLKDQTTDEYESNVTIKKLKAKKGGLIDLDQQLDVRSRKLTWRERRQARRKRRRKEKADL